MSRQTLITSLVLHAAAGGSSDGKYNDVDMPIVTCPHTHIGVLLVMLEFNTEMFTRLHDDDERNVNIVDDQPIAPMKFFDNNGFETTEPGEELTTHQCDFICRLCPQRLLALLLRRYFVGHVHSSVLYESTRRCVLTTGFMYDPLRTCLMRACSHTPDCIIRAIGLGMLDDTTDNIIELTMSTTACTHTCAECIRSCVSVATVVSKIIAGNNADIALGFASVCIRSISLMSITCANDLAVVLMRCVKEFGNKTTGLSDIIDNLGSLQSRPVCILCICAIWGLFNVQPIPNLRQWLPDYIKIRSQVNSACNPN